MKSVASVLALAAVLALVAATVGVADQMYYNQMQQGPYLTRPAAPAAGPMLPANPDRTAPPVNTYVYPNVPAAGCPCEVQPTCPTCQVQTCPCQAPPPPAPTCGICGF